MPRKTNREVVNTITRAFLEIGSVRSAARICGMSRNTVRGVIRAEGLTLVKSTAVLGPGCSVETPMKGLDFTFLERLFDLHKEAGENADFEAHIKRVTKDLSAERERCYF